MAAPANFSDAIRDFRELLAREARPRQIVWVFREDVAQIGRRMFVRVPPPANNYARADRLYDRGMERGLGVGIEALTHTDRVTYAWVFVPADSTDAQYSLIGGEHLKLSVPQHREPTSEIRNRVAWWLISLRASTSRHSTFVDLLPRRHAV